MSTTRKEIEVALRGKEEGASGLVESLGQKLKLLKKEARASGENNLEEMFGGGNFTEGAVKLLGGAKAALAGFFVEKGGEMLGEWAEKANELSKELNEGKISTGEMLDKLAGGVPIFGSVWSAGRSIHDLLVGNTQEIDRTNEEARETREIFDAQAESSKMVREQLITTKKEIIAMKLELAKVGVGPTAGALLDIENFRTQKPEEISESFKQKRDALNADHTKQTDIISKRRGTLTEQMDNIGGDKAYFMEPEKFENIKTLQKDIDQYAASTEARYQKQLKALNDMEVTEKSLAAATAEKRKKEALENDPTAMATKKAGETAASAMATALQEELRAAGKIYEAELKGIQDHAKEEQAAAIEAAQAKISELKLDPNSAAAKSIMGSGQQTSDAIGRRAAAETIEAKKRMRMEEGDALSVARQKDLALNGDMLGSQLEQIRSSYADRIELAKTQAEKEALIRQQVADEAEAKRSAAIENADKEYSRKKEIQSVALAELDENAATSGAAKRAAIKAHIEAESADKIQSLQKIIDDKTSSADEKQKARDAQAKVRADATKREKSIDSDPLQETRKGIDATLLNDRYTGAAEQYRDGQEPALLAANKTVANTAFLKTINEGIAKMAGILQKGIAVKGRAVGK